MQGLPQGKNTYRYKVKLDGKVIEEGTTLDLNRRACDIKARFPGAIVKQVGKKGTFQDAERWLARRKA